MACGPEAAGGGPGPAGRIVQFRAREITAAAKSSSHEHLAAGQQRRHVQIAWGAEAAGVIKTKRSGRAGLHEYKSRPQQKQREGYRTQKN